MKVPFVDPSDYVDVGGPDNLASLQILEEETILKAVKGRYEADNIHTYVGDILLILNPYTRFPLYSDEIRSWYSGGQHPKDLVAPHPFKVADTAYENMCRHRKPQCFVISGESGAGKTETTKIIVSQVMYLCRAGKTQLEEKIKNLNPFLESFGNAKTGMNNNSSRFGKYIELTFDEEGSIGGASMSHYLLEKSRVTFRNDGEQSFHVFYQIFAGLSADGTLGEHYLTRPSEHRYLANPPGPDDAAVLDATLQTCGENLGLEWQDVLAGLEYIGVEGAPVDSLKKILAGILRTGDIDFRDGAHDSSEIINMDVVDKVADLLKVNVDELTTALTTTVQVTRGEKVVKYLNSEAAASNRDAMAKMIFNKIFVWIFEQCNEILADQSASSFERDSVIGVLDIFGFEVFKHNSLEQMCIDLTNEQLQGYFNHHIFVAEQEEYRREGIDLDKIEFSNNQETLDLFLKKGGLFAILDEETRFPKATDLTFTQKCAHMLRSHPSNAFKPATAERDLAFEITHYAGAVTYNTESFLEKNRDKLSDDITEVLIASQDALLAKLFDPDRPSNQLGSGKKQPTLCSVFSASLRNLMERMGRCQPHFIRCLKTNSKQKPSLWEEDLVTRQLRYAGVLETIRIRKLGYSFRVEFSDFVKSYNNIVYHYHQDPPQSQETACKILEGLRAQTADQARNFEDTELGKTKVFMKYYHSDMLNAIAKEHATAVGYLQKISKGHIARQHYLKLRTEARKQKRLVADLFKAVEDSGERVVAAAGKLVAEDERATEDRAGWLERVKMQAAMAEATKLEEETKNKELLSKMADEPAFTKTSPVNGYFIWQRNEHLTLKKGPLRRPWRKKLDEATGRFYFKNTETRTTTWVDPRTFHFEERPHNPTHCVGDQLPFGWDKAETETGTVFYIDHVTNTHHRLHPREEIANKIQQRNALEAEAEEEIAVKVKLINDMKKKLTLLTAQESQAVDTATVESIETRKRGIQHTIAKEMAAVEKIRHKVEVLTSMINRMQETKSRDVLTRK